MCLLHQRLTLHRADPRETSAPMRSEWPLLFSPQIHSPKHADLVNDVVPVSRRVQFLREQSIKLLTHRNNPICHCGNVSFPLFKEASVRQDQRDLHMHCPSTFVV
jgi:hypothetical protein